MIDNNYIPISQLPSSPVVADGNEYVIISKYPEPSINSDMVSYRMPIVSAAPCLSIAMLPEMSATLLSGFGDLSSLNKEDIEYDSSGRHVHQLTSFSHKRIPAVIDNTNVSTYLSNDWYAVSAITQNYNHEITNVKYIDLRDVSATANAAMLEHLARLKLDKGLVISNLVGEKGIPIAQYNGKHNDVDVISTLYSGDPRNLVKISPQSNVGDKIAEISFGGMEDSTKINLYNALNVNTVNPSYNPRGYVGETIAYINGVELKNNVSVMLNSSGDRVIATINGYQLSNGVFLTDTTTAGSLIAKLNGNDICNGVVINGNTNIGRPICNIAGVAGSGDIYNNVNVDDKTDKAGNIIAEINGKDVYNGVVIADNQAEKITYINGHKILAGIDLGSVTQNTTTGNIIAYIQTSERPSGVPIYNGIDTSELSGNIVAKLEAELAALRAQHENDMAWIRNELKKYMLLNSGSATQTVVGPTTFLQRINGNITNADYAVKAQWS